MISRHKSINCLLLEQFCFIIIYGIDVTIPIDVCCYGYMYTATLVIVRFDSDGAEWMPFYFLVFYIPLVGPISIAIRDLVIGHYPCSG